MTETRNITIPSIVAWETTRRCELLCRHCRASAGPGQVQGELDTAEGHRLVDALAGLPIRLLILTGGEPMMREDIYELAADAAQRDIRVVMAPCGPLLNPDTAARLKAAGVAAVSLSLDGATAATHDAFRGIDGAYETALTGLRCAHEAGLAIQINTTVTRLNVDELPAILDLAKREGAATMDFFFLVPTGRGRELKDLQLDAEALERTLHWIADMDAQRPLRVKTTCAPQMARVRAQRGASRGREGPTGGCMAGRGFLFISHVGTVQPCGFLELPCGNVREFDFDVRGLLQEAEPLKQLGALEDIHGQCGACAFLQVCGGCRARALEMGGSAFSAEPYCVGDNA